MNIKLRDNFYCLIFILNILLFNCKGLLCELYYNYEHTSCISEIEEGFYCNSTEKKTIDKCHNNCKTCKKGPIENNNNCLTCPSNITKYFDLGNCTDNCPHGIFTNNSIENCKCRNNISCEYCTEESNELNLCVTCNNDKGYYLKSDDPGFNGFVNCYKEPEGYYLVDKVYEPCYPSCRNCTGRGNDENNMCTACKEGFEFKNDFENDYNCYKKCDFYYYYYDSYNKYQCINNGSCPDNLNKIIKGKNRCVENCNNYNLYEYNNECINECPNGTHIKNNKCVEDLNCEIKKLYYNYDQSECVNEIPTGYYCNNYTLRTIDKCHDNCRTCEEGGNDQNNNCLTCNENGKKYFDLGNCKDICENDYFVENSINKCKCSTNIKCKFCSEESKKHNLCVSCNIDEKYFPKNNDDKNIDNFINCYNEETILCEHNYYFNSSKYFCTENDNCPEKYFLIKDKKKCINDCTNDDEYKYQYENICYNKCPYNTTNSNNNNFLCEPCIEGKCGNLEILKSVNNLIEQYPPNVSCDNNYVSIEDNEEFTIFIYQNNNCPEESSEKPLVDFGECYNEIKKANNIDENDDLIVSKIELKENHTSVYSFYAPDTLQKLDSTPCNNKNITIQEDVTKKIMEGLDGTQEKFILHLLNQGINVFNVSDEFYTDLCYHYDSPNGRDVPLQARLSAFFPNITLCDKGCENVGVNLETMKAKCECKFIDLVNIDLISGNVYGDAIQEIFEIISELNIAVIKCFKDIFNKKYFLKNTGGFIILSLFIGQVTCFIKYAVDGLYYIRKYLFELVQSYMTFIGGNIIKKTINTPPKKKIKRKRSKNSLNINNNSGQSKNILLNSPNINNNSLSHKKLSENSIKRNSSLNNTNDLFIRNKGKKKISNKHLNINNKPIFKKNKYRASLKITTNEKKFEINNNNNLKIDMKEYLSMSFDENDFDDVIDKEQRTFGSYFCEKLKNNQIFINAFYINETLRPKSLKILVLIMTIELYFVINAFFYNENYLTDLFYSTEEEKFYSFIPRRFNEFIYTSAVSSIISYFVGYVFIDEDKIKKIFRRNKEGDIKLKYEISMIIKDIQYKFNTIISFSLGLTVFCFVYISCLNNVYPNIKNEWIKSSLFILFLMQIINFSFTLIECSLRYISIKCNSEKIFKLSQMLAL